jgi:hypothetical protein
VTANLSPLIGTVQKRMPTLTRTATNPNPLAVIVHLQPVTDPRKTRTNAL